MYSAPARSEEPRDMPRMNRSLVRLISLGALLALVLWALRGPPGTKQILPEVALTEAEVAHISARWMRQWNRPPTRDELRKAVGGYVRDEILYREALARALDREDPTVRLALIQKMRLLAAGRADAQDISEQDLASFFALRTDRYRVPPRLSIAQVYFRDEGDDGDGVGRAELVRDRFSTHEPGDSELAEAGDGIMLETVYQDLTAPELERLFGSDFAAEVLSLPPGTWSGPVRSGYGLHVVKILERTAGRIPDLAEVRDKVENDLRYENRKAAEEQGYQEIAGKYRVVMTKEADRMLQGDIP